MKAINLCFKAGTMPAAAADTVCPVSYGSGRRMSHAARSAFKALERDSNTRLSTASAASAAGTTASGIDTLCMVTYSDDEDAQSAWSKLSVQQDLLSTAAAAAAVKAPRPQHSGSRAASVFAALWSVEEQADGAEEGVPEVMETLCMLSYDEESA